MVGSFSKLLNGYYGYTGQALQPGHIICLNFFICTDKHNWQDLIQQLYITYQGEKICYKQPLQDVEAQILNEMNNNKRIAFWEKISLEYSHKDFAVFPHTNCLFIE